MCNRCTYHISCLLKSITEQIHSNIGCTRLNNKEAKLLVIRSSSVDVSDLQKMISKNQSKYVHDAAYYMKKQYKEI